MNTVSRLLCGAALGMLSQTSNAQTEKTPAPAADTGKPGNSGLQDIIVTARHRAESVQKVPIAVTVQTGAMLAQHEITSVYQLESITPSLQVESTTNQVGATRFAIRGVGTAIYGPQVESSVGVVIDDVVMSRPQFAVSEFSDIGNIEVLRGPQGMLFGKNASSGLVKINTNIPKIGVEELIGQAQYANSNSGTSGNQEKIEGTANIPLTKSSALRLTAFGVKDDGNIRNIYRNENNGMTEFGGRLKALWQPSSTLSFLLSGDYTHENGPAESTLSRRYDAPGGLIAGIDAASGIVASAKNDKMASDAQTINHFGVGGVSLKTDLQVFDGYTITNIAAYREYNAYSQLDTDSTPKNLFNVNSGSLFDSQFTEELRLTSPSSGRFTYQAGFFFLRLRAGGDLTQEANIGVPLPAGVSLAGSRVYDLAHTSSYAGFFEGQYKLTDFLRLTAGGRYTHDDVDYLVDISKPANALSSIYALTNNYADTKENNISYRFGIDYDIAHSVLGYVTYARGYKAPTFDGFTGSPVAKEIPEDFEIGLKSTLLDHKLRLNVALFHTLFKGYQAQGTNGLAILTLNAGALISKGVEVELTALPVDGLTLTSGATYNATKYKNFANLPCYYNETTGSSGSNVCFANGTTDVSGNQLAQAPRFTVTTTARYERPISEHIVVFLQSDVYYRSSYNFTATKDPHTEIGQKGIFGFNVGGHSSNGLISASIFVRNVFDVRVPSYISEDPLAGVYGDAAKGGDYFQQFGPDSFRTIGVSVTFRH